MTRAIFSTMRSAKHVWVHAESTLARMVPVRRPTQYLCVAVRGRPPLVARAERQCGNRYGRGVHGEHRAAAGAGGGAAATIVASIATTSNPEVKLSVQLDFIPDNGGGSLVACGAPAASSIFRAPLV
jgi:hypothetical protein